MIKWLAALDTCTMLYSTWQPWGTTQSLINIVMVVGLCGECAVYLFFILILILILYTSLKICRKFGPPYLSKATAAARAPLPSPASACWVFLCFCNTPNSDMDYRIFNMHIYVIILMRAYTHRDWAHRQWVSTTFFDSEKLSQICLVLLRGF